MDDLKYSAIGGSMKIGFELIEMMSFFWEQVASREKIQDAYLVEMAEKPEMKVLYGDDFTPDSFRKVLSAISNKELLSAPTKAESRFWNLNMWMLEDLDNMRAMLDKVKKLNLDDVKSDKNLVFIPGHLDECYEDDQNVYLNFYKIFVNPVNPEEATVSGTAFETYVRGKVQS